MVGNGKTCTNADVKYSIMSNNQGGHTFISLLDGKQEDDVNKVCGCHVPLLKKGTCKNSQCCQGKTPCNEECSMDGLKCVCKHDFTNITTYDDDNGVESWKCIDETPPMVRLLDENGDFIDKSLTSHMVNIKQCDTYIDYGYDVEDDNKDRQLRKFEMYGSVPTGCLKDLKTYNLTFKTWIGPNDHPWNIHSVTRIINVEDINECELTEKTTKCKTCLPKCDLNSKCLNQIGSYSCKCPVCGQNGDGFQYIDQSQGHLPIGYVNGTGCRDSCPPKITLLDDDEIKVFKVCKCMGPLCMQSLSNLNNGDNDDDEEPNVDEDDDIMKYEKQLIKALSYKSNDFCSLPGMKFPCAEAKDLTIDGKKLIDISDQIIIGKPIHVGPGLVWNIPYDVMDDAGNKAPTVFKEVSVCVCVYSCHSNNETYCVCR